MVTVSKVGDWFIWNQHNDQFQLAQLVERCTGIAQDMGLNPVQAWIFFRPYFTTTYVVFITAWIHHCIHRKRVRTPRLRSQKLIGKLKRHFVLRRGICQNLREGKIKTWSVGKLFTVWKKNWISLFSIAHNIQWYVTLIEYFHFRVYDCYYISTKILKIFITLNHRQLTTKDKRGHQLDICSIFLYLDPINAVKTLKHA